MQTYFLDERTHFPISHMVLPFVLGHIFFDNLWVVVALIYMWESVEATLVWISGDYSALFPSQPGRKIIESVEDSLILDPMQAAIAIALCHFLRWREVDAWYTQFRTRRRQALVLFSLVAVSGNYLMEIVIADMYHLGYLYFAASILMWATVFRVPHSHSYRTFLVSLIILLITPMLPMTPSYVFRTWVAAAAVALWKSILLLGKHA